jgi:hypothetical protein
VQITLTLNHRSQDLLVDVTRLDSAGDRLAQVRDPDEVLVGEPGRWLPQPGCHSLTPVRGEAGAGKAGLPWLPREDAYAAGAIPLRLFAVDLCTPGLGDGHCRECRIAIWLGKPSRSCGGNSRAFHDVTAERFSN